MYTYDVYVIRIENMLLTKGNVQKKFCIIMDLTIVANVRGQIRTECNFRLISLLSLSIREVKGSDLGPETDIHD
jgi:hypothetical protein